MNIRSYLRILRPWRTLTAVIGYSLLAWLVLRLQVSADEAVFLTFSIIGPAIAGGLLLGPIHEMMHRSFFPTLPGGWVMALRWYLCAASVSMVGFATTSLFLGVRSPAAAIYGVVAAATTFPLFNRRRRTSALPRLYPLTTFILVAILLGPGLQPLVAAAQHAPWAVLAGGLAFAGAAVLVGFSRRTVFSRWSDPVFFCFQSTLPFIGRDVLIYAQREAHQGLLAKSRSRSAEWSPPTSPANIREWTRVAQHARHGHTPHGSRFLRVCWLGGAVTPVFVGVTFVMQRWLSPHGSMPFPQIILGDPATGARSIDPVIPLTLAPFLAYGYMVLAALVAAVPAAQLPISRRMIAATAFLSALRSFGLLYAAYLAGTVATFVALSLWANGGVFSAALTDAVSMALVLPAAVLLTLNIYFLKSSVLRVIGGLGAVLCTPIALTFAQRSELGHTTLWAYVFGCGVLTALAAWLTWFSLRRHYATCDLSASGTPLNKLGIGIA